MLPKNKVISEFCKNRVLIIQPKDYKALLRWSVLLIEHAQSKMSIKDRKGNKNFGGKFFIK